MVLDAPDCPCRTPKASIQPPAAYDFLLNGNVEGGEHD
jgi:hypothetical protein